MIMLTQLNILCVFSDRNIWKVKRKIEAGWINYPNIPPVNENQETELDFSILLFNSIKAIQPIFYAHSIISEGTNPILLDIIDHLCRGINIKPDFYGYHY